MERDELDRELERRLARHAAATESLAPAESFTATVMAAVAKDAVAKDAAAADPLAGIARATSSLDAEGALSAAVMERVSVASPGVANVTSIAARRGKRPASWLDSVVGSAPVAIGLAAVAAAASFWIFLSGQGDLDSTVVSAMDPVEVSE